MLQSLFFLSGCVSGESAEVSTSDIRQADVAALKEAMAGGAVVVDVRTTGEYSGGHVPGATNIPVQELPTRIEELRPHAEQEIWLICQSGGRSMTAAGMLLGAGMKPVNVTGGTKAWKAAGYPVE